MSIKLLISKLIAYLQVQSSSRVTSESSNLVQKQFGCLADEDPHALPLLLYLPGDGHRVRHHTEVGDLSSNNNSKGRSTK